MTGLTASALRTLALLCALGSTGCATVNEPDPTPPAPPTVVSVPEDLTASAALPAAAASAPEQPADPSAPSAPRARLDPEQDAQRGSLWDRIQRLWAMPELAGPRVAKWEQYYAKRPEYLQRMFQRGSRYLFYIVEEVERRQLPAELALLPFIESAFNPQAMSRARASGMWQFMPATGKDFELRQNIFRDDRRDVLASTRAALDYLERLHALFGDWHLALAAYNWGQGSVARAIKNNRRAGLATDYASLRMPAETRDYVPKLQAMKNIFIAPARLGLVLPRLDDHPYFLSVAIERDIDVDLAARLAGMKLEDFEAFNPQLNKPVILGAGTPQLQLPYDNANQFVRELPRVQGPLSSWTVWVAPKTLKPGDAAREVGMSEAELRDVNGIPPNMLVKAGSTLLVPRGSSATLDVGAHAAQHATIVFTPEGRALRRVRFKAGREGDTVAAVASRYRVSAAQVAGWNGLSMAGRFRAGAPIIVMLEAPALRKAAGKSGKRQPAKAKPARKKSQR